jgi:hypothetical protein
LAGATSNTEILGTQPEHRQTLIHHNAADAATKHMTQDAHVKSVRNTDSRRNRKHHAVGCEYIHIDASGLQLSVYCGVGVRRELRNEVIPACNVRPPWSTKAFVSTVCEIAHHDVVSSGIFADEFPDKHPREWTK